MGECALIVVWKELCKVCKQCISEWVFADDQNVRFVLVPLGHVALIPRILVFFLTP